MNQYPSFKSLLAFDAAMRSNSFSVAARDLSVTPGAIGQQIQKLEEWLGVTLFIRQTRQIQPTEIATKYWQAIRPALGQIANASHKLREHQKLSVSLSMPPSFAAKWFTRRMARLLSQNPKIDLHLNATTVAVDFERDSIDLAIRYFDGRNSTLDATILFSDEAHVYCSPSYAASMQLKEPADLRRGTLLVTTMHPHWEAWLSTFASIDAEHAKSISRIHFDQGLLAIDAAKHGQGAVLTSPLLVRDDLNDGLLIEPFECPLPLTQGFYIVHPNREALRKVVWFVKQWLIEEAQATALDLKVSAQSGQFLKTAD